MFYKAIIFDLDGTLLDTLEDLGNAANRALSQNGFPVHELDAYRYFVGDGAFMLFYRALPVDRRDDDTVDACVRMFREEYGKNWNIKTRPYNGVPEMLDTLASQGIKMAVFSNKPDDVTKLCVAKLLPQWRFDVVLGHRNSHPLKPDPSGASEIAGRLNVPSQCCVFLGDTAIDMKTAVAAGMFPVGALWGFRTEKELLDNGARMVIRKPQEILNLLKITQK